jgi:hypothetical protein
MSAFSHAEFVSRSFPQRLFRSKSQTVASRANWSNMSRIGWIASTGLLAFLLWQVAAAQPLWPHAVSGLLLFVIGVLAGLHIGASSAAAYTNDVQRLNKLLADQNRELQDANAILLKQVASESPASRVAS